MDHWIRKCGIFILAVLVYAAISGCASTKAHYGYKVDGQQYASFKELDDEQSLKMVVMLYNVPTETYEDKTAKNITITKYMELLQKRKSDYIAGSGVFDLQYEKIDLKVWPEDDLISVYRALAEKPGVYDHQTTHELSENDNATKIVRLTGMEEIVRELRNRQNTRQAWSILAQVLTIALNVALAAI